MAKELKIVTTYGQRDGRWAGLLLGYNTAAQYSIGNYGCLITSIVNYLNAIDKNETPQTFNDKLKANDGFVNGGLLVWEAITRVFSDVKPDFTSPRYESAVPATAIAKLKSLIDSDHMVLIEVDFNPSQTGEQMHWVLAYGYDDAGNILIIDPWTGTKTTLAVYGKIEVCMYSYRSFNPIVTKAEEMVCDTKSVRDMLVVKATQRDDVCTYLELSSDLAQTDSKKITSTIGGYKSRVTDLTNQLTQANAEVTNREEQVGRLKEQVLSEQNLRKDLTDKLNDALKSAGDVKGVYEGQLAQKQTVIDGLAKDKGVLQIQVAQLTQQLSDAKKNSVKALSIGDLIRLIVEKVMKGES